jgi:thiol-disulfide isomerase/thioredoxin
MSASTPAVREKQAIGLAVTDFQLPLLSGGGQRSLGDFLEGKRAVVVLFWSGVCSHCLRYDGRLNRFGESHPDVGLVAVASRQGETPDMINKTIAERKLTFPIVHDPPGAVAHQWYTQQTPRAFLIDSSRKLLYRGAIDNYKFPEDSEYQAYLEPAIASFLAGEPIARTETASFGCAIQSVYYILPKLL